MNKEWDYRIVRKQSKDGSNEYYSIQEVYYGDDSQPVAQTIDLMIESDTIAGVRTQLERMLKCLDQPPVDELQDAHVPFLTSDDGVEGTWEEGQKYIYESPDGGKTIYRRKFGKDDREELGKGL